MRPLLLALFLLPACAGDPSEPPTLEQRLAALETCEPTDLVVYLPWTGPAFDPETGALREPLPAGHVEAFVNGWPRMDDEAVMLRQEFGAQLAADVFARDGLLGFESVESVECGLSMSHTLWRDEAAMLAFVSAEPHVEAMLAGDRMHHDSAGAHWTAEARTTAPDWREGLHRFAAEVLGR
jgi:heme-degrading monooxygenase HmoA